MYDPNTPYVAKKPDKNGIVHYTAEENATWRDLIKRQMHTIQNRGCSAYIEGLKILHMSEDRIPQLPEINEVLQSVTGWSVAPVAAIIPFNEFFTLLANCKFPAATFIRTREDFDYIKEPDIFHELYGHCPMLTDKAYAKSMQRYGEIALNASHKERVLLARLYWFTVEFGLIRSPEGPRIYGGGILSSHNETIYAVDSPIPERKPFDALETLRTPYRIDIMQTLYFTIENFTELYNVVNDQLMDLVHKAQELGDLSRKL